MEGRRLSQKRKAAALARASKALPDSQLTAEQRRKREENRRYRAAAKARKANGASAAPEISIPLEAIPERMPTHLRERAPARSHHAPEASIGGVNARLWFAMELLRFVRGE